MSARAIALPGVVQRAARGLARVAPLGLALAVLLLGACGGAGSGDPAANAPGTGGLGPQIAFWVICVIVAGGALATVLSRNAVSAVMSLVATFFGLAALYTLLSAHFVAALQVLVYAGAIMTLFVFVVMVLNREEVDLSSRRGTIGKLLGIIVAAGGLLWLGSHMLNARLEFARPGLPPEGFGGVEGVGMLLFNDYLFPFEAISFLLLIAVIAAVVVARIPKSITHPEGGIAPALPPETTETAPEATHSADEPNHDAGGAH